MRVVRMFLVSAGLLVLAAIVTGVSVVALPDQAIAGCSTRC